MTIERMIELLEIEHECMLRGAHDDCDRKCADCELVQEDDELHEMYTNVVRLLKEHEPKQVEAEVIIMSHLDDITKTAVLPFLRIGVEMGMSTTESVVNDLNIAKLILCNSQLLTPEMCIRIGQAITSALALLQEQEEKKGQWIPIKSPTGVEAFGVKEMTVMNVRCSVCGSEEDVSFTGYKYCPRCGAKMEGR